jgi:hypothetical protein
MRIRVHQEHTNWTSRLAKYRDDVDGLRRKARDDHQRAIGVANDLRGCAYMMQACHEFDWFQNLDYATRMKLSNGIYAITSLSHPKAGQMEKVTAVARELLRGAEWPQEDDEEDIGRLRLDTVVPADLKSALEAFFPSLDVSGFLPQRLRSRSRSRT